MLTHGIICGNFTYELVPLRYRRNNSKLKLTQIVGGTNDKYINADGRLDAEANMGN